jgi:hypothetical protein
MRNFILAVRTIIGAALGTCGLGIAFIYGTLTRLEDSWSWKAVDIVLGLIVATAYCVFPSPHRRGRGRILLLATLIWLVVSGSLLSLHHLQWYLRTTLAPREWTRNRIMRVYEALDVFARDAGSFPTEGIGLSALLTPSGLETWCGPYVTDEWELRDCWDNVLNYTFHDGTPLLWSSGPDGVSGTKDDVTVRIDEAIEMGL